MATITQNQPASNLTFHPIQSENKVAQSSQTQEISPSGDTEATLHFFKPPTDGTDPRYYVEDPPEGEPKLNFDPIEVQTKIHDIRSHPEFNPTLNDNAFAFHSVPTTLSRADFDNEDTVKQQYYKEVEEIILAHVPGAKSITIFDHTIRTSDPEAKRAPVNRVHIDQTKKSGVERVHHHHPEDAEQRLQDRVRIINVWRAINAPVLDNPLAYADAASVTPEDLVSIKHIYPDRIGATAGVKYNPKQKWWYRSGFDKDDVVLLQCFDTHGKQSQAPHTAFNHPQEAEMSKKKGRESIEVRCLVWG